MLHMKIKLVRHIILADYLGKKNLPLDYAMELMKVMCTMYIFTKTKGDNNIVINNRNEIIMNCAWVSESS